MKRTSCRFPLRFGVALADLERAGFEPDQRFAAQPWPAVKSQHFYIPASELPLATQQRHKAVRES